MIVTMVLEDVMTPEGPGVDIKFSTNPPTRPEDGPQSIAHHLALQVLNSAAGTLELAAFMAKIKQA